ncbi:MAG TPA: cation transporter [Mycobacteriales bacterium]|nr:cation transporter [Mycobacteriales bacterium]
MTERRYTVEGMSCQHCIDAIASEVTKVPGVTEVGVDLAEGTVTVTGDGIDDAGVRAAIDEAGYEVVA